jgi:hypothetical protein
VPLEWRNIDLPFAQGLDQKSDPLQIPVGKLSTCENGRFVKGGRIEKRKGFTAMTGSATAACAVQPLGDQLVRLDGETAYTYSIVASAWESAGTCISVGAEPLAIPISQQYCTAPDVAYLSGVEAYAYVDSLGHAHFMTVDANTRAVLVPDTDIASPSAYEVKVLAQGTNFLVLVYKQGTQKLSWVRVAPTATSVGAMTELTTYTLLNPGVWDALVSGTTLYLAYRQAAETVRVLWLDSSFAELGSGVEDATFRPTTTLKALSLFASGNVSYPVGVAYTYEDTGVNTNCAASAWNSTITASTTPVHCSYGGLNDSGKHVAGIAVPGSAGQAYVFASNLDAATPARPSVHKMSATFGTSITAAAFAPNAYLQSKPFAASATTVAVPCVVPSTTQGFGIVLSQVGFPLARTNVGATTVARTYSVLSESPSPAANTWLLAEPRTTRIVNNASVIGLGCNRLTFADPDSYRTTEIGGRLLIPGAVVEEFDGGQVVETGFLKYPDFYRVVTPAGGSIPAGTYEWCFTYQWTDSQGVLHESAPCPVLATTFGSPSQMTFYVECNAFTAKSNVRIVGYRTQDIATTGDTTFYRFTTAAGVTNSKATTVVAITDNNATWATTNEVLYTGGSVENIAPSPAVGGASWKARCWLIGADGHTLWYSKKLIPGYPVEFNDGFSVSVEDRNGPVKALAVMDDHLLVFTATAIYHLVGEGPDNLGQADDYGLPQLITTDVGCARPGSIVTTPNGLMFQSAKGIYLLSRSFQAQFVGAPVEDYTAEIVAAVLMPDANEVRFTQATRALVYNYYFDQWSTFTITATAVDAGIWRGSYYYARTNGTVELKSATYADDGAATSLTVTTGWLPFSGLQGYQRVRDLLLLATPVYSGSAVITASTGMGSTIGLTGTVIVTVDGTPHTCTISYPVNMSALLSQLNAGLAGSATASTVPTNKLTITSASTGRASTVQINSGTLAASALKFTDGQYANANNGHTVSISLAYDYVDDFDTPVSIDSNYVESGLEQFRVFVGQPRCEAVKVKVVVTPKTGAEALEMPSLSGLTLRAGGKRGFAKTPAGRQFGA